MDDADGVKLVRGFPVRGLMAATLGSLVITLAGYFLARLISILRKGAIIS